MKAIADIHITTATLPPRVLFHGPWLRRQRGMAVVLLAHSAIETVNDPRAPAYSSYQLRLHKRARGLVQDEVDAIGFLATDVVVQTEDAGFNRKRHRADGGSSRWLHFEGRPAFLAKSRFDLPAKLPCPKDFDVSAKLASMFPSDRVGTQNAIKARGKSHD